MRAGAQVVRLAMGYYEKNVECFGHQEYSRIPLSRTRLSPEHPAISNSNPFPLFFSHLPSAISNSSLSHHCFQLSVRDSEIQLYCQCSEILTRVSNQVMIYVV